MTGRRIPWTRLAIVAIAVTWAVVATAAVLAHCSLPQPSRHAAHPNHPVAAAMGAEFAVDTHHAHLAVNSIAPCPLDLAATPDVRSDATVFARDMPNSVSAAAKTHANLVRLAGRGPPVRWGLPCSGRDLLTRYCLTRR